MKYYLIAGEASGDLHGSNLVRELLQLHQQAVCRAWGGDRMEQAGCTLVKHYRDLAFMGFVEVVSNLRTILNNLRFCKRDILAFQPDALILIDYPGFNLRIAKWAHQQGIKVHYYISPQIWAWNSKRVHGIKRSVDYMYCILPFEKSFYQQYGMEVEFVGHPLLDVIEKMPTETALRQRGVLDQRRIVALLPGSRRQEISSMLLPMLKVADEFTDYQFVVAAAPSIDEAFYRELLKGRTDVTIISGQTYELLQEAHAALVTSGTATLETALFDVPEVVCYRGSRLSYQIARRVINVPYISLVNLVLDKPLVEELIQRDFNEKRLHRGLQRILDPQIREDLIEGYQELRHKLGESGASHRCAARIIANTRQ